MSLFSIITPFYNRWPIANETLACLQAQTYGHWEWVVVDDGPEPAQWDAFKQAAAGDKRIRCFERQQYAQTKGANVARNVGMQHAQGDFLVFLDSDDVLTPNALANRLQAIEANPNFDFWVFQSAIFYSTPFDDLRLLTSEMPDFETYCYRFLNLDAAWWIAGPTYKKYFLIDKKIIWTESVTVFQDLDFHLRILAEMPKFKVFEKELPDSFWRWGDYEKTGKSIKKAINTASNLAMWVGIYNRFQQKALLTERLKLSIYRHVFELVLNPLRKSDFEQANLAYQMVIESYILDNAHVRYLRQLLKLRYLPLGKYLYVIYYKITAQHFHRFNLIYFGQKRLKF